MKPAKKKTSAAPTLIRFILIYGILVSLAAVCFLNLSASLAGFPPGSGYRFAGQNPRLIPCFWIAGGVCLLLLAMTLLVNLRRARRLPYTLGGWILQWLGALGLTLLLMRGWDWAASLLF